LQSQQRAVGLIFVSRRTAPGTTMASFRRKLRKAGINADPRA